MFLNDTFTLISFIICIAGVIAALIGNQVKAVKQTKKVYNSVK